MIKLLKESYLSYSFAFRRTRKYGFDSFVLAGVKGAVWEKTETKVKINNYDYIDGTNLCLFEIDIMSMTSDIMSMKSDILHVIR